MDFSAGLPPMLMLSANHYPYRIVGEKIKITIPRRGSYKDIDAEFFKDNPVGLEDFDIFDEETNVIFPPQITKVLLATEQYPALKGNEVFVPLALIFNDESIDIIGSIFEMLDPDMLKHKEN